MNATKGNKPRSVAALGLADDVPDDLASLAVKWLVAAHSHRTRNGTFGKVQSAMIDTPSGRELHLTEETTFRPSQRIPDAGVAAMEWVERQTRRRQDERVNGSMHLELSYKLGKVTHARVVEITIIGGAGVDSPKGD